MIKDRMTPMGRRIYAGMVASGISTPAALAKAAGIARTTAHRWLNEPISIIDAPTLYAIADVVHLSARWILTGEGSCTVRVPASPSQRRLFEIYSRLTRREREALMDYAAKLESTA